MFDDSELVYMNNNAIGEVQTSSGGDNTAAEGAPCETVIVLNVGGTRFETFATNLPTNPGNPLYNLSKLSKNYRATTKEYFFDRDPIVFREVLNFYRTGEFHFPLELCGCRTKKELTFWGLDDRRVTRGCCGPFYNTFHDHIDAHTKLKHDFADKDTFNVDHCWGKVSSKMWNLLEKPSSSTYALVYCVLLSLIALSLIIVTILMSRPEFVDIVYAYTNGTIANVTSAEDEGIIAVYVPSVPALAIFEMVCVSILTFDFIVRLIFCPKLWLFVKSPWNIIDFFSVFPYYLNIVIVALVSLNAMDLHVILTIGKIFQVLRIFRVLKHYSGFILIAYTLKTSITEILLFVVSIGVGVIVYSSLIYFVEPETFPDIPSSCWWVIVTMTTVGYGDVVPKTPWGYVVGTLCAMTGLLIVAFTIPMLVNNFVLYFTHMKLYTLELKHS